MSAIVRAKDFPLRIRPSEEFVRVREFFHQNGFDDVTLCRTLRMDDMADLGGVRWEKIRLEAMPAPQRWCLDIFVRGLQADRQETRTCCGDEVFTAFLALGLLRPAKKNPSAVLCPVWVYPVDGFIVASDRRDDPEGDPFTPAEDVVFPAIYAGTLRFLRLLPEVRQGEALDLCGGSGIGALHLSRTARAVVTADLTERSARFAAFNAGLNGVGIESLCGDLYSPVAVRKFDLISAHPPFVPATGPNMVYRDGGETGEDVIRQMVEGLPQHLRSGGTCVILCVARDTQEQTFEQRVAAWLGPAGGEFDVVFGLEKILSVGEVVDSIWRRGQSAAVFPHEKTGDAQMHQLVERLESLGTRQFVYGALVLRRCAAGAVLEPFRIGLTPAGTWADFERLLVWRDQRRQPHFAEWLAKSRPQLARQLRLNALHLVQDGQLVPAEFVFSIETGFHAALRPDGWIVPLAARLEGTKSVQEVFEAARLADELPEGFTLEAFLDLVQRMIERGFLELKVCN